MSEIQPIHHEVNLPAIPDQQFLDIASLTSALGIPREVLAPDEEIAQAWVSLPRELRQITANVHGELIARMCVSVRAGLFDGAINYIWNATVLHLRQRMREFGLPVVSQILQQNFEEANLVDLQDSELIIFCLKLNLITESGFFFLNQCRETRNNFSAAHPSMGTINDREFITFLNRCVRYALSDESSPVGVDIRAFISAVKNDRFAENQLAAWIGRLNATHDSQRQLLFGMLHAIYCDPSSPEPSRLNCLDLCSAYQSGFTSATKSDLIDRHSEYLAKGDTPRHNASQQFFRTTRPDKFTN